MYLGQPCLIRLRTFAAGDFTCENDDRPVPYREMGAAEFCEWLNRRLKTSGSLSYVEMLLALREGHDAAAYRDFWSYLDEYRQEKKTNEK